MTYIQIGTQERRKMGYRLTNIGKKQWAKLKDEFKQMGFTFQPKTTR